MGIGLGLVILALLLDRSFNTVEDIEKTLGVPVIGTLPLIQDDHFEQCGRGRCLSIGNAIVAVVPAVIADAPDAAVFRQELGEVILHAWHIGVVTG